MTQLTVLTPPAEPPLSLDAVKAFLRIGDTSEDAFLAEILDAARVRLERVAGLALITQTVRLIWRDWPKDISAPGARLPISPVQQLEAMHLVDAQGIATDVASRFQVLCERLASRPSATLPFIAPGSHIEVDLQVGFGAASDVPDDLREALLRLIGAMYATRTPGAFEFSVEQGLPQSVQSILDARKEVRL